MCVIYVANNILPSMEELERGATRNDDGAGLAWLAPDPASQGHLKVFWKKGLQTAKDVSSFIQDNKLQLPIIIHFRTVSVGPKIKELTHPFPISSDVELDLEGSADSVLFHNGTIHNWDDLILQAGLRATEYFPEGEWSDTRALAWLTWLKGEGVLPFIMKSGKIAVLTSDINTKAKNYSRAIDHVNRYGAGWIEKDGYSQSITTDFTNRGGVIYRGGRQYTDLDGLSDAEWQNWPGTHSAASSDSKKTELVLVKEKEVKKLPEPDPKDLDVWTIGQCKAFLAAMEEEQADAKLAAGI